MKRKVKRKVERKLKRERRNEDEQSLVYRSEKIADEFLCKDLSDFWIGKLVVRVGLND